MILLATLAAIAVLAAIVLWWLRRAQAGQRRLAPRVQLNGSLPSRFVGSPAHAMPLVRLTDNDFS